MKNFGTDIEKSHKQFLKELNEKDYKINKKTG